MKKGWLLAHCYWDCKKVSPLQTTEWRLFKKLKNGITIKFSSPTLGILYPNIFSIVNHCCMVPYVSINIKGFSQLFIDFKLIWRKKNSFTLFKCSHSEICKSVHSGFLACLTVLFYNFLHKILAYVIVVPITCNSEMDFSHYIIKCLFT